jgi:hypothetical protein
MKAITLHKNLLKLFSKNNKNKLSKGFTNIKHLENFPNDTFLGHLTSMNMPPKKMDSMPCFKRSKHLTRSQKGHQILDIINQNQTFIFLITI